MTEDAVLDDLVKATARIAELESSLRRAVKENEELREEIANSGNLRALLEEARQECDTAVRRADRAVKERDEARREREQLAAAMLDLTARLRALSGETE